MGGLRDANAVQRVPIKHPRQLSAAAAFFRIRGGPAYL
jgi:hypothetical protein